MRVSVLETETETFGSQSQLSRPRLRLSEVSLSFETKNETGKRWSRLRPRMRLGYEQFETQTTPHWTLEIETETETKSLADLCMNIIRVLTYFLFTGNSIIKK